MSDDPLWRSPTLEDMRQIELLGSRCDAAEGTLETTLIDSLADRLRWDSGIGNFSQVVVAGAEVIAAGWASSTGTTSEDRDLLYAFADPARPQLYDELIQWLTAHSPGPASREYVQRIERVLAPATFGLPERVMALYTSLGFEPMYVEHEMACDVKRAASAAVPADVDIVGWTRGRHAKVRAAYNEAFRDRAFKGYTPEQWRRAFLPGDLSAPRSFVALSAHRILGFVGVRRDHRREWIDPAIKGSGWIDTLGVVPEYRGRGVATALLLASMCAFSDAGIDRAVLRVNGDNNRARRVYERLGFEIVRKHVVYVRRP